ncbi:MAG: hypothetical protein ACRDON_13205 [Gaiellaceae bacterium]
MARAERVGRALEVAVEIRQAARAVRDERVARRLRRAERLLRREIGPSVPKRRAASLLGVTVAALERWIAAGKLPVVQRPRGRQEIEAGAFLDLMDEVRGLREEEGAVRGVLAAAFRRLGERRLPPPSLRPNTPPHELRRTYLDSTPVERLRDAAELSYAVTTLASYGAGRRGRRRKRAA